MATDKLINQTQGADIIDALDDIATNVGNITYGPQTSADKVVSMLGYAEAAEAASINPGDTLNQAIGKLEKKADDNATAVAGKITKVTNATAGAIATLTSSGEVADSEVEISTSLTDSDTAVPTSKTVKTYVDSTATGISRYLGTITASSQLSTSAKKGDFYVVKTAWSGVYAGDEIIAEKNGPAQTIDGTNWSLLHNEADTDTKYTFATGDDNGTFKVTPSDTGTTQSVPIKGLGNAAYKGVADTVSSSTDLVTSAAVNTKLGDYVPNSDFVVVEDSLAEVVDSGAKNLINCSIDNLKSLNSSSSYSWNGNTVTAYGRTATVNADGTITVAAGTGSAEFWLKVANYTYASGVSYVLSGCPTNGSTTTYYTESDNLNLRDIGSGVVINSATTDALYVVVKTTGSTPALTFKPMLCTKAAFGVSQKFVPYRPNYDLVGSAVNSVENSLKPWSLLKSGDDLNNIVSAMVSRGVYFMFAVGNNYVSNIPTDGIFMVRTTWLGGGTAVQEVTMLTGNDRDKSYVRTFIDNNNWSAWKQTTNV